MPNTQLLSGFSNLYASCLSEKNACHMNPTLDGSITLKYLINLEAIIIAFQTATDCFANQQSVWSIYQMDFNNFKIIVEIGFPKPDQSIDFSFKSHLKHFFREFFIYA